MSKKSANSQGRTTPQRQGLRRSLRLAARANREGEASASVELDPPVAVPDQLALEGAAPDGTLVLASAESPPTPPAVQAQTAQGERGLVIHGAEREVVLASQIPAPTRFELAPGVNISDGRPSPGWPSTLEGQSVQALVNPSNLGDQAPALARPSDAEAVAYGDLHLKRWQETPHQLVLPVDVVYDQREQGFSMRAWVQAAFRTSAYLSEQESTSSQDNAWLRTLKARRKQLPVTSDLRAMPVSPKLLSPVACVAVLQTMLLESGFEFVNIVPVWGETPGLSEIPSRHVQRGAETLCSCLGDESLEWHKLMERVPFHVRRSQDPRLELPPPQIEYHPTDEDGDLLMTEDADAYLGKELVLRLKVTGARARSDYSAQSHMPGPAMGAMVMMATHAGGSYPVVESDMMAPAPAFMAPYPAQVMQLTAQHPVAAAHSPVAMPLPGSPDSRRELRSPGGSDDRMGDEDEAAPSEPSLRLGETHPPKSSRSRKSTRSGRSAASSSRSGASEVALMMMRQQEAALIQTRADMAAQPQRIQEQMQRDAQLQKEEFMAELQRGTEQFRAEAQNKAPEPKTWKESKQTVETRAQPEADQRAAERRLVEAAQALDQREQEAQAQADQLRQQAAQAHAMQTQAYEAQVQALRAEFEKNQAATQKALRERDEQLRTALKMQQEWKKAAAKPSSTLPAETVTPASTTGFKPAGGFPTYIGQKQTNADEVQALQLAAALQKWKIQDRKSFGEE
ncbi:hypothetical protein BBJ28_00024237 [Nothophytophthora sp. Chile5]|nr:hypothetical protein BBJ28_00024237 [Nothophytophthora sp. Chile5]